MLKNQEVTKGMSTIEQNVEMLVNTVFNITGRGKAISGDTKNGKFCIADKVEIIRDNAVIGYTEVKAIEMFSTVDRKSCLAIILHNIDGVDVLPNDYIRVL